MVFPVVRSTVDDQSSLQCQGCQKFASERSIIKTRAIVSDHSGPCDIQSHFSREVFHSLRLRSWTGDNMFTNSLMGRALIWDSVSRIRQAITEGSRWTGFRKRVLLRPGIGCADRFRERDRELRKDRFYANFLVTFFGTEWNDLSHSIYRVWGSRLRLSLFKILGTSFTVNWSFDFWRCFVIIQIVKRFNHQIIKILSRECLTQFINHRIDQTFWKIHNFIRNKSFLARAWACENSVSIMGVVRGSNGFKLCYDELSCSTDSKIVFVILFNWMISPWELETTKFYV